MKWALLFFLALPAFGNSTVNYIPLNSAGGSFLTTWNGQPDTSIGGVTSLRGSMSGFNMDIWASDNHGLASAFYDGAVSFTNGSWGIYAALSYLAFDPNTGMLTASFRSCYQQVLPGGQGIGFLWGTFNETLLNGSFGGGYLSNVVSTVPEPGTWSLVLTGALLYLRRRPMVAGRLLP